MTDSGLRLCSWDTKGVYIDLLCIMAESNRYGYLEINDKAPTQEMLIKRLSIHHKTLKKCLRELQDHGILSSDNGVLYSRKMTKQFTQHAQQKDFGKKGGNPTLNPTLKAPLNPTLKVDKELDTDKERKKTPNPLKGEIIQEMKLPFESEIFKKTWNDWILHRKEIKKPLSYLAQRKQLDKFSALSEELAIKAIDHSICNGYQGVFEEKQYKDSGSQIKSRHNGTQEEIPVRVIKIG